LYDDIFFDYNTFGYFFKKKVFHNAGIDKFLKFTKIKVHEKNIQKKLDLLVRTPLRKEENLNFISHLFLRGVYFCLINLNLKNVARK